MKKVVGIASIVFWLSFVLFMITFVVKSGQVSPGRQEKILQAIEIAHQEEIQSGKYVIVLVKDRTEPTYVLSVLGILMAVCFMVMEDVSEQKPKIKPGRLYKLEKFFPLKEKGCAIVLSYKNEIETYKGLGISAALTPVIGKNYLIKIEKGEMIFIE